jgi:hypothetical protein
MKPQYISQLETAETANVFSVMNFHVFRSDISKFFEEKKLLKIYERSHVKFDGNAVWDEILYRTDPFYLHIENKSEDIPEWYATIYYKPEKFNEVLIFIRQTLKQLRYGGIDIETN